MIEINETEYPQGEAALIQAITDFQTEIETHKLSQGTPAPIVHPAVEKALIAGDGNWVFKTIPIPEPIPEPAPLTYKQKRQGEYPSIGDMIDAMAKALEGEASEFTALQVTRTAVKAKYPKPA